MDLELRALFEQGYKEEKARDLVRDFSAGKNPDGRFVFHFTTAAAAEAILVEGFRRGGRGYSGQGIYACTVPTPSRVLKLLVLGLWNKPARIPIDTRKHQGFDRVPWPPKTVFCELKANEYLGL